MIEPFEIIVLVGIFIVIYLYIQKYNKNNKNNKNNIKNDKLQNTIKKNTKEYKPIEKQFLEEQEHGVNLRIKYPNTWIEKINPDGTPEYNSREKVTGIPDTSVDPRAEFSYKFNENSDPVSVASSRVIDINGPDSLNKFYDKTLKEIYEKSCVDYKDYVPYKEIIENKDNLNISDGASHLKYINPDMWVYQNEKPENGGKIADGLYAVDMDTLGTVAKY
jgi:hypothetical protein